MSYMAAMMGPVETMTTEQVDARADAFNAGFECLEGDSWTALHHAPVGDPPVHLQAAWSWRREIWHAYFLTRRAIGRAYHRWADGEHAQWSNAQRDLERLYHTVAALTFHNALEDRIAQLANAVAQLGFAIKEVNFQKVFGTANAMLPRTWSEAASVSANADWKETHDRANEVKHRWTGSLIRHARAPEKVLADLAASPLPAYNMYDLAWVSPQTVDEHARIAQRSLNLLVGLARTLDDEIGWGEYLEVLLPESSE